MMIAHWKFHRPFRTNQFARQIQTLRLWLISGVAPRHQTLRVFMLDGNLNHTPRQNFAG
jgi:hypothetical protein